MADTARAKSAAARRSAPRPRRRPRLSPRARAAFWREEAALARIGLVLRLAALLGLAAAFARSFEGDALVFLLGLLCALAATGLLSDRLDALRRRGRPLAPLAAAALQAALAAVDAALLALALFASPPSAPDLPSIAGGQPALAAFAAAGAVLIAGVTLAPAPPLVVAGGLALAWAGGASPLPPEAWCLIALGLATAVVSGRMRRLARRSSDSEAARAVLSRYLAPELSDALLARDGAADREIARRSAAVLFVDMVGFSTFAERMGAVRTLEALQAYHGRVAEIVAEHRGVVVKLIGDEAMVAFGAFGEDGERPPPSIAAARALRAAIALSDAFYDEPLFPAEGSKERMKVGVGVHHGDVVIGEIGGPALAEFAVLGDTVNIAKRLERLSRTRDNAVVASENAVRAALESPEDRDLVLDRLRNAGAASIEGRHGRVGIYILRRVEPRRLSAPSPDGSSKP